MAADQSSDRLSDPPWRRISGHDFGGLVDEIRQRHRDLVSQNAALVDECGHLRQVVEGLLGVLGKYIDGAEVARWRLMTDRAAPPSTGDYHCTCLSSEGGFGTDRHTAACARRAALRNEDRRGR